jgi:hypothetical protein
MRYLVFLFLFNSLAAQTLNGVYFPLAAGNTWLYLEETFYQGSRYDTFKVKLGEPTIINGREYYNYHGSLFYYDKDDSILYNNEAVYMDFKLPEGTIFPQGNTNAVILVENIFFLDSLRFSKGFRQHNYFYSQQLFSVGVGMLYDHYFSTVGVQGYRKKNLIEAIIHSEGGTIFYDDPYSPIIYFEPPSIISDSIFNLNFTVNHQHTKVYLYYGEPRARNFIDSVYLISYYSKNDSTIKKDTILAYTTSSHGSINYAATICLTPQLLLDNWHFNYSILAKDKGIIPNYSRLPE